MAVRYPELEGKLVVVVGGARGIGRACAMAFASQGANVLAAGVDEAAGATLEKMAATYPGTLRFRRVDATAPDQVQRLAEEAEEHGRLRTVVNCVGGGWTRHIPTLELRDEEWDAGIRLNLYTTFSCCRAFGSVLKQQGGGSIINLSSSGAAKTAQGLSPAFYGVAKAGVEQLTRLLARELGPYGIRVNAIAPGTTLSERVKSRVSPERLEEMRLSTARRKLAEPEEIASVALFLASDESVHVTGVVVQVNGGQLIVA